MDLKKRKNARLMNYDYSKAGAYFVTICTENRQRILSRVENEKIILTSFGFTANKYLIGTNQFYDNINIVKYVIMPNHIHIIVSVSVGDDLPGVPKNNGSSGTPTPTISQVIGTFKRFCNKEYGKNIWQRSFYDHIIRNEADLLRHMQYIDENPKKWENDEYY